MAADGKPFLHVMAGVVLDHHGRVLLAQRPPDKHLGGMWEFPGGKLESGELPFDGLVRELQEELGLTPQRGEPLIRVPCHYPERLLLLDAWLVEDWRGEPESLEGQAWQWCQPDQVDPAILTPADRWILQALRLPSRYRVTPVEATPERAGELLGQLARAIERGEPMIGLELPLWPRSQVRKLAAGLLPLARRHGTRLLLSQDIEGALAMGIGVQLKPEQLARLGRRPLPWQQLVGVDCHDAGQLEQGRKLSADFACLGPLLGNKQRPQRPALGWDSFSRLVEASSLPVYARGGVLPLDLAQARRCGGQGVTLANLPEPG